MVATVVKTGRLMNGVEIENNIGVCQIGEKGRGGEGERGRGGEGDKVRRFYPKLFKVQVKRTSAYYTFSLLRHLFSEKAGTRGQ